MLNTHVWSRSNASGPLSPRPSNCSRALIFSMIISARRLCLGRVHQRSNYLLFWLGKGQSEVSIFAFIILDPWLISCNVVFPGGGWNWLGEKSVKQFCPMQRSWSRKVLREATMRSVNSFWRWTLWVLLVSQYRMAPNDLSYHCLWCYSVRLHSIGWIECRCEESSSNMGIQALQCFHRLPHLLPWNHCRAKCFPYRSPADCWNSRKEECGHRREDWKSQPQSEGTISKSSCCWGDHQCRWRSVVRWAHCAAYGD